MQLEFNILVKKDTSYAVFSVSFVFVYFIIHLRSVFLASVGIMLIMFSFSVTAIVCEGIFRVTYYADLHSLVIFIVLGIAADDIFVFIDAWRQSAFIEEFKDKKHMRMSYSWKRAVRAMAVTSSTTSVAFLANSFSPIMPIKAFGIYAAIIIPANYLLVVLIFPPAVIWYEDKIEGKCCFSKKAGEEKPSQDLET
jgi:predicted RND superfamily exporter protein